MIFELRIDEQAARRGQAAREESGKRIAPVLSPHPGETDLAIGGNGRIRHVTLCFYRVVLYGSGHPGHAGNFVRPKLSASYRPPVVSARRRQTLPRSSYWTVEGGQSWLGPVCWVVLLAMDARLFELNVDRTYAYSP